ncbi:MAG TPA: glycogen debranching N-terminal domain-containing protein, partial [Ilumatobacteraceae bacterium]|nr:glycogen debranching N-terminal domain-containing protein [Ilumatobacteraceae bacterium]
MTVEVPHPTVVLHGDGMAMACGLEGDVRAEELHGLFVADTRVLSSYRITIAGQQWQLVGQDRQGHGTATWTFQSPLIRTRRDELPAGTLFLQLRRRVSAGLHDDLTIKAFGDDTIDTRLIVQLDSDFADIFEVKDRRLPPRLDVVRTSKGEHLTLSYDRAGFRRALHIECSTSDPRQRPVEFVGSQLIFELTLAHGEEWRCCLHAE